jgi:hypothetical protein
VIDHDKEPGVSMVTQPAREPEFRPAETRPTALTPARGGSALARTATAVPIAPIVPLVHVPDDPGPDAPPHIDPERDSSSEPTNENWRKLRDLFK